jgi:hypothetical protein
LTQRVEAGEAGLDLRKDLFTHPTALGASRFVEEVDGDRGHLAAPVLGPGWWRRGDERGDPQNG